MYWLFSWKTVNPEAQSCAGSYDCDSLGHRYNICPVNNTYRASKQVSIDHVAFSSPIRDCREASCQIFGQFAHMFGLIEFFGRITPGGVQVCILLDISTQNSNHGKTHSMGRKFSVASRFLFFEGFVGLALLLSLLSLFSGSISEVDAFSAVACSICCFTQS